MGNPSERFVIHDPYVAEFGVDEPNPEAWAVHYLTRHLTIACQPDRDLEGAPLNTVNKNQVTCPACADAITGKEPA